MGGDAEEGGGGHAPAGFFIAPADGAFIDRFSVVEDEGDGSGDFVLVDGLLEERADAGEAFGGEGGIGGGLSRAEAGEEGEEEDISRHSFDHGFDHDTDLDGALDGRLTKRGQVTGRGRRVWGSAH